MSSSALAQQQKDTMETSAELEKAVAYFRDRLALQLKKVSGTVGSSLGVLLGWVHNIY